MYLFLFLLLNFSLLQNFVSCNNEKPKLISSEFKYSKSINPDKKISKANLPKCRALSCTYKTPYMVYVLYKSSGHFLGMGAIIDHHTVLTCFRVVSFCLTHQSDMLVLAGSLTPWWGKDSQVRRVKRAVHNEYEIALLNLKFPFIFNDRVKAIKLLNKKMFYYYQTYGDFYVTYGITQDSSFTPGIKVKKNVVYEQTIFPATIHGWTDCDNWHRSMVHELNQSFHICGHTYGFQCHGLIGAPVLGSSRQGEVRLVGVVISTMCLQHERFFVVAKLTYFDLFLKTNSLLGYKLRNPESHNVESDTSGPLFETTPKPKPKSKTPSLRPKTPMDSSKTG